MSRPFVGVRFDVAEAEADTWSDALLAAGALSADIADPAAGTPGEAPLYGEPGTVASARWPVSRISALFEPDTDVATALRDAAADAGLPLPACETYPVADEDWVRATQAQFGPIAIGPGFWIVPTWSDPPDLRALNLRLDPGLAFGTGSHPSTRLCLEWLREHVTGGETVLDYGCGSGILAIAAKRLGAGDVIGIDVDPQAIAASEANARLNGVAARFALPAKEPTAAHALVVANILANPLIVLAPLLARRVAADGRIALSGILAEQAAMVTQAYARWFTLARWRERDGWVLLAGERSDR